MKRLTLLLLLCPAAALGSDNPLLGRWRTCLEAEDRKMLLELTFRDDGTVRHAETPFAKTGCEGAPGPTRSRPARYSYLREKPEALSFEFTSDYRDLQDDEEAWLSGTITFLSRDTMSFKFTDLIMMHGGKPTLTPSAETSGKPADVFHRVNDVRSSPAKRLLFPLATLSLATLLLLRLRLARKRGKRYPE